MIDQFSPAELDVIVNELRECGYFTTYVHKKTIVGEVCKAAGLSDLSKEISKPILLIADIVTENYEASNSWCKEKGSYTIQRKRNYVPLEIEAKYRNVVESLITAIKPYVVDGESE